MTPISTDLLEEIRDFIRAAKMRPGPLGPEGDELLARIERCLSAEPTVSRAWLLACLQAIEAGAVPVKTAETGPTTFNAWTEEQRPLVVAIVQRTGREPVVAGGALLYWLRDAHGEVTAREYDLTQRHAREGVLIALRDVARIVRLDHQGEPLSLSEV